MRALPGTLLGGGRYLIDGDLHMPVACSAPRHGPMLPPPPDDTAQHGSLAGDTATVTEARAVQNIEAMPLLPEEHIPPINVYITQGIELICRCGPVNAASKCLRRRATRWCPSRARQRPRIRAQHVL